jgi:hypothetical protein
LPSRSRSPNVWRRRARRPWAWLRRPSELAVACEHDRLRRRPSPCAERLGGSAGRRRPLAARSPPRDRARRPDRSPRPARARRRSRAAPDQGPWSALSTASAPRRACRFAGAAGSGAARRVRLKVALRSCGTSSRTAAFGAVTAGAQPPNRPGAIGKSPQIPWSATQARQVLLKGWPVAPINEARHRAEVTDPCEET